LLSCDAFGSPLLGVVKSLNGIRTDGTVLPGFPKITIDIGNWGSNCAAVADFDGDGKLELAWGDLSHNAYLWDLDAPVSTIAPWPMFQHDAAHTGRATPFTFAPTNLKATAGNARVSLTWTASVGATSYNVKRSTTSGSGFVTVASGVTATNYLNTGLTNGGRPQPCPSSAFAQKMGTFE